MSQKQPIEATVEFLASQQDSLPSASEETADAEPVANSEMPQFAPPTQPGEIGRLGKYRIQKELGRGGMGAVYLAFDERLQRQIALKVMLPKFAANANAKDRFLREARAAARISSDHVVNIHEADEIDGTPYIALQLLQGYPLDEYLKKKGTPSLPQIMRIGKEMAIGLAAAHKLGLVHRDIKPGNVWLEAPNGRVKILDFGLAKPVEGAESAELTAMGAIVGTPAYMAPEQGRGETLDGRADLFSLGCVLYRLCTGKLPFDRPTLMSILIAIATEEPKPVRELNPNVPAPLANLIHRLLSKNAADRPANAQAVVKEFDGIIAPIQKPGEVIPHVIYAPMAVSVQQISPFADIDTATDSETIDPLANEIKSPPRKFPAILVGSLLFALIAIILAGFIVIKITNKDGTVTEVKVPKDSKIEVDGKKVTPDSKKTTPLPPEPLTAPFKNGIGMEFVKVPKGTGWLGGGAGKQGETKVVIEQDFYLGKYEVTQEEWEAVTGQNPSHFSRKGPGKDAVKDIPDADLKRFPVENVSWDDCQLFIERLNKKEKDTGWVYRLPTADEWEYACRSGPVAKLDSAFNYYFAKPTNTLLLTQANFAPEERKGLQRSCKVGSYEPNLLGLYDMHGNVYEWSEEAGRGADGASLRIIRGGHFFCGSDGCRATDHYTSSISERVNCLGLRLARVPVGPAVAAPAAATDPDRKAVKPIVAPAQFMEVHGVTLDAFKEWAAKLPKGYQPSWISLRSSGEVRFDAVATLVPKSREWKLIFVNRDDDKPYYALKATHRLARCGNYKVGDKFDYFTLGIFDNQDGQESSYWYGNADFVGGKILEGFKLERELNGVKERWLPYSLIAYDSGDGIVYQLMSSWQPDAACEWHPELTADELATKIAEYRKKGWRPHIVSVHSNREDMKFLAVFTENKANETWEFTPNLSVADYETQLVERKAKGQLPRCVASHIAESKVSYTVVWDRVPAGK